MLNQNAPKAMTDKDQWPISSLLRWDTSVHVSISDCPIGIGLTFFRGIARLSNNKPERLESFC